MEYVGDATTAAFTTNYFKMSSDFSTISNENIYTANNYILGPGYGSVSISLDGTVQSVSQDYLPVNPEIYEMISNTDRYFFSSTIYKTNYLVTASKSFNITA